ncbi:putative histidine kinase [Streptomyces sp. NBRC 110611]|uniref:sensor histidine kinase n=1 Tax=Streptomyces sp. NBRC 110611 TaxID=1621259 RepID=UPI00082AF31A|nr:histidine kinase [Streptomyces sp. NBRC 110611]GAU70320.1 putative histidine kinase [Streptomyces sp. NBRC 110611]
MSEQQYQGGVTAPPGADVRHGQQAAAEPRGMVMSGYRRLCDSRWKNTIQAVLYGVPLVGIAVALPYSGLVASRTAGVTVSVVISVATVWRERLLVPYSLVSAVGVVITGHLLSATGACYTAVRQGRYVLASMLVVGSLAFVLATPEALVARAPNAEAILADSVVIILLPVLLGYVAQAHRQMAVLAAEQQAQEALLQEGRLREAALRQRERLVRDIHNGVGQQVTLMVLQAGAIAVRADASAPIKERCSLISDAGRDAVNALREIVAKTPGPGESPTEDERQLSDLAPLFTRYRSSGHKITVGARITAEPPGPVAQDLAYKVIAEGLSNAVRHAAGGAIDVRIAQAADASLIVAVHNGPPPSGTAPLPGTGHGLSWLRQEIQAAGGTLRADADPAGGFLLEARFAGHQP